MKTLKIAVSRACPECFTTSRDIVDITASDYIDVAAVVLAVSDIFNGAIEEIEATGFGIPVFIARIKKKGFRLNFCRVFTAFLSTPTPAMRTTDASLKRLRRSTKPSSARRSSARWSITSSRGTARLTAPDIREASSSAAIRPETSLSISLAKRFSAPICAMPTWQWAIC